MSDVSLVTISSEAVQSVHTTINQSATLYPSIVTALLTSSAPTPKEAGQALVSALMALDKIEGVKAWKLSSDGRNTCYQYVSTASRFTFSELLDQSNKVMQYRGAVAILKSRNPSKATSSTVTTSNPDAGKDATGTIAETTARNQEEINRLSLQFDLDEALTQVQTLEALVAMLKAENAALKAENAALKAVKASKAVKAVKVA